MCIRDRVGGGQDVQVNAGSTVTVKLLGTLTEQLVHDASEALRSKEPVSYTHLDVYKRQG